ncbi:tyrosine-type recombinase/integrase [bacterium]|nr:tyrosine-type recombinase/integrase [bacterium]
MPRPKSLIPAYLLHKPTGQARVRIHGKDHYLGPYGSEESRQRYGELVAKVCSGQMFDPLSRASSDVVGTVVDDPGPSIAELWLAFLHHAERYYVKNGKQTDEVYCFKSAMAPVIELYGLLPISEFRPSHLKAARSIMVDKGWCRKYVNKSVCRVRHVFKWGIESDMVEPSVLDRLRAIAPLLPGKTEAKDHPEREAVPLADIEAVKKRLKQQNRDLIDLQLVTGARPGELIMLTTGMIDRGGSVWVAKLVDHKTLHHGKTRKLYFGPKAQLILSRYLKADPDQRLFATSRDSYGKAVTAACTRAGVKRFSPHWLRHNVTTEVRDSFGIEAAQAMAGHARPDMTANYSRKMDKLAAEVAAKIG